MKELLHYLHALVEFLAHKLVVYACVKRKERAEKVGNDKYKEKEDK